MRLIVRTLIFIAWVVLQVVFVLLTGIHSTFDYVVWAVGLALNLVIGAALGALWAKRLL